MRLDWIEDLLAVAETGSLAAAAERRHLSASAFSRRIREIEAQLGAELVDRRRKPLRLTPAAEGQREAMAEMARGLRRLGEALRGGAAASHVALAAQHALAASLAPGALRALARRRPEAQVRLRSANLAECFALLLSGRADAALLYRLPGEAHPIREGMAETRVLGRERLIPVAAPGGAGTAGELPYVAYPREVFLGQVMERRLLGLVEPRWRPVARAETALTLAALELARQGVGVAWVPAALAAAALAEGALEDLSGALPSCALEVTAVRLAGRPSALAAELWDGLAEGVVAGGDGFVERGRDSW